MIIVDINQIMISNLMVTIHRDNLELGEDLIRHMVLNSLRGHNKKFRKQYGEMVIACDRTTYGEELYFLIIKQAEKQIERSLNMIGNTYLIYYLKLKTRLNNFYLIKL